MHYIRYIFITNLCELFQSEEVDVEPIEQYVLKVLVNGKSGAGKTSIIQRFTQNLFRQHRLSNGTVDMYVKVMNWNETTLLQLNFWDIPGTVI